MARPGRKRKMDVDRYANGSPKPDDQPSPCVTKRLVMASLAGMADPQWGTVAGRYYLSGALDPNQYEAAKKYGVLCETYSKAVLGPKPPKTSTGERGSVGGDIDPDTELGQLEADNHVRARQRYNQAKTMLLGHSPIIERELNRFCVGLGEIPNYEDFIQIKKILTEFAEFWKIDVK